MDSHIISESRWVWRKPNKYHMASSDSNNLIKDKLRKSTELLNRFSPDIAIEWRYMASYNSIKLVLLMAWCREAILTKQLPKQCLLTTNEVLLLCHATALRFIYIYIYIYIQTEIAVLTNGTTWYEPFETSTWSNDPFPFVLEMEILLLKS